MGLAANRSRKQLTRFMNWFDVPNWIRRDRISQHGIGTVAAKIRHSLSNAREKRKSYRGWFQNVQPSPDTWEINLEHCLMLRGARDGGKLQRVIADWWYMGPAIHATTMCPADVEARQLVASRPPPMAYSGSACVKKNDGQSTGSSLRMPHAGVQIAVRPNW